MSNDVSIFFEKRKIVLTENLEAHFNSNNGLFTRYRSIQELSKILEFFQSTTLVQDVFISGRDIATMTDEFSCMFRFIEAAGGLVINSKGEYLVIYRYNKWDLPKGKLEPNEEVSIAALREVSEETGITNIELLGHITDTFHTYKLGNATVLKKTSWFSMRYTGSEKLTPQESEDISIAKWLPIKQIDEVTGNTYDTIRQVLSKSGVIK